MGRFTYGPKITVDFDDRVLAHLQTVIAAKIRRGESFMFTWIDDDSTGAVARACGSTRRRHWGSNSSARDRRASIVTGWKR